MFRFLVEVQPQPSVQVLFVLIVFIRRSVGSQRRGEEDRLEPVWIGRGQLQIHTPDLLTVCV